MAEQALFDYIDKSVIQETSATISQLTGLDINIIDKYGESVFFSHAKNNKCEFCNYIYHTAEGLEKCKRCHKAIGALSAKHRKPYISICHAGIIEIAVPLLIMGESIGSILCGRFIMWDVDDVFLDEVLDSCGLYIDDFTPIYENTKLLPKLSKERAHAVSNLLYLTSNYLVNVGWMRLMKIKDIELSQSVLYDTVYKPVEETVSSKRYGHLFNKNEILDTLLQPEKEREKYFTNKISEVKGYANGDLIILRRYITEFIEVFSKACMDASITVPDNLVYMDSVYKQLYESESQYDIISVAAAFFNRCCRETNVDRPAYKSNSARLMVRYIQKNYMKQITLEELSAATGLNRSYVSRHFKESVGTTFSDYLLSIRMENAKSLLEKTNYPISQIAYGVGYQDPAYFTKLFRVYEGITPTQYRISRAKVE